MKNYIGEGKSAKNFAKEYLERRSKYRNAIKQKHRRNPEDDLLSPAQAINPNDSDEFMASGAASSGGGAASGGGGGNSNKQQSNASNANRGRRRGKDKGAKTDGSHLLGFNVTAGSRVNAGELDTPQ